MSVSRRRFLGTLAALPVSAALATTSAGKAQVNASLAAAARRKGRYFGSAVRFDQLAADSALRETVLRECSVLVPEVHLNWDHLEPNEGEHTYEQADALIDLASAHNLRVRGHMLLWDQSTPAWAKARLAEQRDWSLIARHFRRTLRRYAGRVGEWEVVNEAIDTEHGEAGLRRNCFYRAFGPGYIRRAFREARRRAPRARLMINDYGFDYDNPVDAARRLAMLRLVERLKRDGTPIHGVGVQAHLDLSKGPFRPQLVRDFLNDLAQLEVDIVISELDVKEHDLAAPVALRDARVAAEAAAYLEVALDQPAVRGIVTWGLSDRHSWLQDQSAGLPPPESAERLNRGLPFDAALNRKPMYWAMHEAFLRA